MVSSRRPCQFLLDFWGTSSQPWLRHFHELERKEKKREKEHEQLTHQEREIFQEEIQAQREQDHSMLEAERQKREAEWEQ